MERRTVRIYKAPNGQGEYINKTKKFLQKAQMGAETTSENVIAEKQIEALKQYVTGALSNDMEPEEVYKLLISKGIPKEIAYPILTQVMQEMEAPEEEEQSEEEQGKAEESKIGQTEYQPAEEQPTEEEEETDSAMNYYNSYSNEEEPDVIANSEEEFQDGGPIFSYEQLSANEDEEDTGDDLNDRLASLEDFVGKTEEDDFKDFGKDISEYEGNYTPIEWDVLGDGYGYYKKGGSKKNFTKNVLALIKRQEGGDAEESNQIGRGNKKDTLTNDVSKIKSSFTNKLKEVSSKAAIDSIYEKMMKSNNPELMQSAQELAQNRQKSSQMGSFEPVAQQGGYIGENQPDMFSQGGFDIPQAQKGRMQKLGDFLLGEKYTVANNPYNVKTGALYKDPVSGLTPIARTVHKRGILGRPKKYTDYYQKAPSKVDQDFINNFSEGRPKANIKKSEDVKSKDNELVHGMSEEQWDSLPGKAKRQIRRGDRRVARDEEKLNEMQVEAKNLTPAQEFFAKREKAEAERKQKELEAGIRRSEVWSQEQGMDNPEWWDNGTVEAALPEGLTDEDIEMIKQSDAERENLSKVPATKEQRVLETYLNPDSPLLLNNSNESDFLENWYIPTLKNAEDIREEFKPSLDVIDPGLGERYKFSTGKSKATQAEEDALREAQEQEEADQFEEDMIRGKRGYKYGGILNRYQIKGAVKSPTNNLNTASDPTATSGNLVNMLKPQENSNSFMGANASFMNQNIPGNKDAKVETIEMDPNQTKDQKITSLDFGTTDEEDLIAQDVKTKRAFDGVNFNNKLNMGLDAFTGAMNRLDQAKQQNEMYANNFNADSIYGASTNKDRGDYVAYGQQTGMFRPNETGQETSGRFAYGQKGGYMGYGGYTEGDEVDMTEEELAEFIANGGEVEYL